MKKNKYLIFLGVVVLIAIVVAVGWRMSDREDKKETLEIYTYEDIAAEITTEKNNEKNSEKNDEEDSEIYIEYTSDIIEYELTKEDAQLFVTFTEEKLDEQMFDKLESEDVKNLYNKYKDAIVIYSNKTENMYIADMRISKGEIKGSCEYDEKEQNYKYRIEYGEKVFEDVYDGEGVVVLLISDFSCTQVNEKDLYNITSGLTDNSFSLY